MPKELIEKLKACQAKGWTFHTKSLDARETEWQAKAVKSLTPFGYVIVRPAGVKFVGEKNQCIETLITLIKELEK